MSEVQQAKARCPKCGSSNIGVATEGKTKGYDAGSGCLGTILLGPLGLLCGACGLGSSKTKAVRMCIDCGKKF